MRDGMVVFRALALLAPEFMPPPSMMSIYLARTQSNRRDCAN
jgi:hypothetical protein